jgi:hypothetical protein
MTQKLTPNQAKWIAALRSGCYEQTTLRLHDCDGHCCLGVAAQEFISDDVVVKRNSNSGKDARSYDGSYRLAPVYVLGALGLHTSEGGRIDGFHDSLSELNDGGTTFEQIADLLEASPDVYFKADHTA